VKAGEWVFRTLGSVLSNPEINKSVLTTLTDKEEAT
jgi:hypothetical protein